MGLWDRLVLLTTSRYKFGSTFLLLQYRLSRFPFLSIPPSEEICLRKQVATNASHRRAFSPFPTISTMSSRRLLRCPTRFFHHRRSQFLYLRWRLRRRRCPRGKSSEMHASEMTTIWQTRSRCAPFLSISFLLGYVYFLFRFRECLKN